MALLVYLIYILAIAGGLYYLLQSSYPENITIREPQSNPLVSIIIPTRNEERNIARCLESLMHQNYSNTEIIVVDGNSTDDTVKIATSYDEVTVVREPDRPEGWVGKPWACYFGYQQASGEVFLFTDADTSHRMDSLKATLAELEQSDGFISLLTTQEFKSFWEHLLSIVFLIISLSVRGTKGTGNVHIANGQYMMFTRATYEQLGTHQVVADSIIEDLAFGTLAAKAGNPPKIIAHHNLVRTRMYRSLDEIQEGFGKNLALGVREAGIDSLIGGGFISIWAVGWFVLIVIELLDGTEILLIEVIIIIIGYLSFAILLYGIETQVSTGGTFYVLIYPLYFIVLQYIILTSMIQTYVKNEIVWKDQTYSIK